jgi:hypothetical protein
MSGPQLKDAHPVGEAFLVQGPVTTPPQIDAAVIERAHSGQAPITSTGTSGPDSTDSNASGNSGAGSTGNAATSPSGSDQDSYVVVLETKSPHHTLATAQDLPDVPYFGIIGAFSSADVTDLYRMVVTPGMGRLEFELVTNQSAGAAPMQFELFSATGQVLGQWSVGSQGTLSLQTDLTGLAPGSTLYLGLTASNSSPAWGGSTPTGYQLWITREATTSTTSAEAAGNASGTVPALTAPLTGFTSGGTSSAAQLSQASPGASSIGSGIGVAVGSPIMRSPRPSGGLLSDGDPAPPADRDFNALASQVDEKPLTEPAARDGSELEPTVVAGQKHEPDSLVVLNGPGGFPLLAAVAIGHRRRDAASDVGDFATNPAATDWSAEQAAGLLAQESGATAEISELRAVNSGETQIRATRQWWRHPISVFSGLGLATVFTLNALFSQPIAGFDFLAGRLEAAGRSRNPMRSRTKPTTAPRNQ